MKHIQTKSVEEAREQFAKDSGEFKTRKNGTAYGAFIFEDLTYGEDGMQPCHAFLSDYSLTSAYYKVNDVIRTAGGIKYLLDAVMFSSCEKDLIRSFISWMANESPYKDIYIDKDADSILKYGYLIDANFPTDFIASACIAARVISEFPDRAIVWGEISSLGVDKNEAFIYAHLFSSADHRNLYPMAVNPCGSGHSPFEASYFNAKQILNFLQNAPVKRTNILKNGRGYGNSTINSLWGPGKDMKWVEGLKMLIPRAKVLRKDYHIFRKEEKKGYVCSNPEDLKDVLDQVKERIYA